MTDTERLDWLERQIVESGAAGAGYVVLGAWWSGKPKPDGFSVNVGELFVDGQEYPTLREAIDAEAE